MTGDPERMDGENAFHMFNEIAPEIFKHGDADRLLHILTRLEEEQPETYAAERSYLLLRHLEAAAVAGRVDEGRRSGQRTWRLWPSKPSTSFIPASN